MRWPFVRRRTLEDRVAELLRALLDAMAPLAACVALCCVYFGFLVPERPAGVWATVGVFALGAALAGMLVTIVGDVITAFRRPA